LQGRLEIWFGLYRAQLSYIGVAPGSVGLYQFNVVVPEGVRGEVKLSVMLDGEPLEQQTKLSFATEP
jgi:uncharacterized protein (TIGR03437 family)